MTCRQLLDAFQGRITRLQIVQAIQAGRLKVYTLKGRGYYDPEQVEALVS